MSLGPWNSFRFGPSAVSTKVAYALVELELDPEDPDVPDRGNSFSVRGLLCAGYAKLEMKRRDA